MLIGGYYEERRLVRVFGQDYLNYRMRVGAFFPRFGRPVSNVNAPRAG
jgi:protein-S-isoprenylcysteine O-methyltransferase Ste14